MQNSDPFYSRLASRKWDLRFMLLAEHVASWSRDPSTKVGAVIVEDDRKVLGVGYNGFPRGVADHPGRYADREIKYAMVVHAELNAIHNCTLLPKDATLYCTLMPCNECAKSIIQAGIQRVVSWDTAMPERWSMSMEIGQTMFKEAGVIVYTLEKGDQNA